MTRQISIRWNSDMGQDYGASIQCAPAVSGPARCIKRLGARLKGEMSGGGTVQAAGRSRQTSTTWMINVTLTATWDDEADVQQLRLFGPNPRLVTQEGEIVEESTVTFKSGEHAVTVTSDDLERLSRDPEPFLKRAEMAS